MLIHSALVVGRFPSGHNKISIRVTGAINFHFFCILVEKEKCMKPECTLSEVEIPDPLCPVTVWSDWSPCSTTCGSGISIRTRLLLVDNELHKQCSDRMELYQQKKCSLKQDCTFDVEYAKGKDKLMDKNLGFINYLCKCSRNLFNGC